LTNSKAKLTQQHDEIKVKAEVLNKLRDKIHKKQKSTRLKGADEKKISEQRYYCPFCKTDLFREKELFERHVLELHNSTTQDSQVQNFILELKDKEIAIMELVMKKN
jgi:Mg2+ and Co2+ transporter CorA